MAKRIGFAIPDMHGVILDEVEFHDKESIAFLTASTVEKLLNLHYQLEYCAGAMETNFGRISMDALELEKSFQEALKAVREKPIRFMAKTGGP